MSNATAAIMRAPWCGLDDGELLAHFRSARPVQYFPVVDAEETRAEKIDALLAGVFEFNGENHLLSDPVDWLGNPSADIEWHILLHKFYYAVGLGLAFERTGERRYAERWMSLVDDWMKVTPVGFIAADVTGRRVQNWIYSLHYFVGHAAHDTADIVTPAFHSRMLVSLHEQVEYLCANLTAKRNHRTIELAAIFLAGVVFPEMRRAHFWRSFALEQTDLNLQSDLLADGVHCELSTDYHHLVLKNGLNFRRLAALNDVAVPARFDAALVRALQFSLHVHKPDGIVPSLSDGDARGYLDLLRAGAHLYDRADMLYVATGGREGVRPAERIGHFPAGGYSVIRSDWGDAGRPFADAHYLVFDHGPVGEGNHGHFDCLSVELAAYGRSLIVDPGRYTYSEAGETNWRVRFRGTAAHNTVCVDGRHQTRYEPRPIKPGTRHAAGSVRHRIGGPGPDAALVERHHDPLVDLLHGRACSHEYDASHDRCIVFVARRYWIVSDWMRAPSAHDYVLNFQLGAEAHGRALLERDAADRLVTPGLVILQPAVHGHLVELHAGWVSMRYGDKQAAPALRRSTRGCNVDFDSVLMPWQSDVPWLTIAAVPVVAIADSADGHASGAAIHRQAADDRARGDVASGAGATRSAPGAWRIAHEVDGRRVFDCWFHARGANHRRWRIGRHQFEGRWLLLREDEQGRLLGHATHAGAQLVTDDQPCRTS